ncbi:MAG: hypothetical protein WCJ58_01050 [bacterium]
MKNNSSFFDALDSINAEDTAKRNGATGFFDALDSINNEEKTNKASQIKTNVFASTPIPPEKATQQYQMSRATGIPIETVRAKENEIKQMTELNSISYDDLVNNFPKTAAQLADSSKTAMLRDDVDNLTYFEKIVGNTKKEFQSNEIGRQTTDLGLKSMAFDVTGNENFKLSNKELNELYFAERDLQKLQNTDYKLGLFKNDATELAAQIPAYTLGQIPTVVQMGYGAVKGYGVTGLASGAIGAVAGAFAGPEAIIPGAKLGFKIGSKAFGRSGAGAGVFTESSKRMTADSYGEYKNFVDETGKPIEKSVAAGAAILTGGIGGLLELIPAKVATEPFKKLFTKESAEELLKTSIGREYLKNIASTMLAEGTTEAAQEYSNVILGEAAKYVSEGKFKSFGTEKDKVTPESILQYLGSKEVSNRVKQSFVAGSIGGAGFATAGATVDYAARIVEKRQQEAEDKKTIKDVVEKAKQSKILQRSPEAFKEATAETLGEQSVYLSADQVQTYFQSKTPQEIEVINAALPEIQTQIQEALDTGGNIVLKGNDVAAALVNIPEAAGLEDFMKLSPESFSDLEAQDAFLQNVVPNIHYQEQQKKSFTEQDAVKKNIEKQILNLGMPYRDAKEVITKTQAYYDTVSSRVGEEEAKKILNSYLGQLELNNGIYKETPFKAVNKIEDLDLFLDKARKPIKTPKAGKPLIKMLKEKGGVQLGSNLAGELAALGINPKTMVGLFKKQGGLGNVDNFVASELQTKFPHAEIKTQGEYVDRQHFLDLLAKEIGGEDISHAPNAEQDQVKSFLEELDRAGIDINASNEEIKKAIKEFEGQTFNQAQDQTQTPAFKKWFGDSKVVDENGKPLVVYHGMPELNKFNQDPIFKTANEQFGSEDKNRAYYFTGSLAKAKSYTDEKRAYDYQNAQGGVVKTYLAIKNPLVVNAENKVWRQFQTEINGEKLVGTKQIVDYAKKNGFDGVVVKNVKDNYNNNEKSKAGDVYVAFDPTQIKSVENKGTFDSENPNIYYQSAFHGTPYKFDKFTLDNIGGGEGAQAFGWGLYFAGDKEIAEWYRKKLSVDLSKGIFLLTPEISLKYRTGKDLKDAAPEVIKILKKKLDEKTSEKLNIKNDLSKIGFFSKEKKELKADLEKLENEISNLNHDLGIVEIYQKAKEGQLYEVNIPEADTMLDWDNMLSKQPPNIQEAVKKAFDQIPQEDMIDYLSDWNADDIYELSGNELYQLLKKVAEDDGFPSSLKDYSRNDEGASKFLHANGINGIKYFDGNSRNKKEGHHNYVVFDDAAIKVVKTYYQTTPTFYSSLEKQITDLPQGKGSPEQWAGIIKNLTQKGVKQEELDWTGIEDWIKEQKGSVTKEQILDYLKANKIEVEEVVKGKNEAEILEKEYEKAAFVVNKGIQDKLPNQELNRLREIRDNLRDRLDAAKTEKPNTKFEKYTLAGGENYRELLLTLPVQESINKQEIGSLRIAARALIEQEGSWKDNYDSAGKALDDLIENPNLLEDYKLEEGQKQIIKNYLKSKNLRKDEKSSIYKSSHYDEPNILAHIRFNERTDAEGKRVMFVEELQSDWHQEGRKKGYKDAELLKKVEEEIKAIGVNKPFGQVSYTDLLEAKAPESLLKKYEEAYDSYMRVPNAPFKTTWNELAFKRALLWAVENGFDKVAWTTGEQQAERYDLSKQVSWISYNKNDSQLAFRAGDRTELKNNISPDQLESFVGKDAAKKLLENEPMQGTKTVRIEGDDLKVGGEGMKAFYDKIVPTMVNKLAKKFGGKVEAIELGNSSTPSKNQNKILTFRDWVWKNINNDYSFNDAQKDINNNSELYKKYLSDTGKLQHAVEITPAMRESIQRQGLPLFQNESNPRGQTQFIGQKPIITLFENKNKSTVLHELGHVFLQINRDIAAVPNVSEQIKKDWKILENWLGIKDGNITTEAHEKFARGFEAYLFEGKAPSIALRDAFARFKSWLIRIYNDNIKNLNVKLTNDVRGVFDRMFASDEAIESLKNNPIFRSDDQILELLTAAEKKDYQKLNDTANEKAKEKLLTKALKQKEIENKKFYKEERAAVKKEVELEMNQDKTFRLVHFLKTGQLLGEEPVEGATGYKLSREDIKNNYDTEFLKYLPADILAKDGVPVDMVAEEFGFNDAGQMLYAIANVPNFKEELKKATDAEMVRRYGDMLYDGTIENEALNASENEARANKILYELNAANRKVKTYVETKEAYKQKAKEIIATKQIKDATDTNTFYLNEVKAAREAGKALGQKDYEKAVEWKKKQLLNHYLFRESLAIKNEVQKALKSYTGIKKKPKAGKVTIDEDFRLKAVNLLQDFNLAPKGVDYQKTNAEALDKWKQEQTNSGVLGLVEFPELGEFQDKDNIRSLTTDEFRTLDDAIQNLVTVGRNINILEVNGKKQELNSIVDRIIEQANTNIKKDKPEIEAPTEREKLVKAFDSYASSLIKTSQTTLKIDGEKNLGEFYQLFEKDLNAAELEKHKMSDELYKKVDAIYNKHFGGYKISDKRTYFDSVGKSYPKKAVLAFALNWGNEINRTRVRDGFNYSDAQVIDIISSLNKNELEFVQDIWDLVNSYWSGIESTQKKLFGIAAKKQNSVPLKIVSKDGQEVSLKGGYYPLAYTAEANFKSDTVQDLKETLFGTGFDEVSFHESMTKERTDQKVTKKIVLDLNPLSKHLTQAINIIAMKPAAWNAYRIINNRRLKTNLVKKIGIAEYKQLQSWVYDMYGRTITQESFIAKAANLSRDITVTWTMAFKLATAIIQPTGLLQSIVKIGYKNMGLGIWKALGNGNPVSINKAAKLAFAKSKILENRSKTMTRDIYEVFDHMHKAGKIRKDITKFAFLATTKMQMLADLPTWYGAYYKGLKDFKGDDAKAVELADRLLIETQGSSYKQSLSAIQRDDSALVKAFTIFGNYANVKLNLLVGSYRQTNFKKPKDTAKFISDFALLFAVDAILTEFLREGISNLLSGRGEDDEEDKTLHYANLIAGSLLSPIPVASQIYSGWSYGKDSYNPSGFKGISIVGEGISKLGKEAVNAVSEDEEVDLIKVMQGINETSAIFTIGGGAQIDIFLKALKEEREGGEPAPIDFILKPAKK